MSALLASAIVLTLAWQNGPRDKPDFSGSWTLESEPAGPEVPARMRVSQVLSRSDLRGRPVEPFFREISITRELPDGPHGESYVIGMGGGTVSFGRAGPTRNEHHRVMWEERNLVIETASSTDRIGESRDWNDRREVWTLDARGNLRIEITTRGSAADQRSVTLVYRRAHSQR